MRSMYKISSHIEQSESRGHDSLQINESNGYLIICLADGAGGSAGGLEASTIFCNIANDIEALKLIDDPDDYEALMRKLDLEIQESDMAGETTAIIAMICDDVIVGASVGDSQCWLFEPDFDYEITKLQNRKPLLGSGKAIPIGFGPTQFSGHILFGSDGLFNYTQIAKIKSALDQPADSIVNLAKTNSGTLHDDCSVIICKKV